MKKIFISAMILLPVLLNADNYQYQYFNGDNKYLPFSDYIPEIRLHYKTVPHYVEDFYQLYGLKLYYNENSLRRNIDRMKTAMNCKFRHPSQALVKVDSEAEFLKYRRLLFMRINLLIMRDTMKIAARYDRHRVKFYDPVFAKEINESLDIADGIYREAIPYWEAAKKLAHEASTIKITTDLGSMESERFSIIKGDLDYGKIINRHITKLTEKRKKIAEYSAR